MNQGSLHPSTFELDVLFAAGGVAAAGTPVADHAASCPECRAYLDGLEAVAASMPPWVAAVEGPAPRRRLRFVAPLSASLAVAAAALLWLRPAPPRDGATGAATTAEVRDKGEPAVALYVLHGARVHRWDGREPIVPGDRLRLEVAAAGFDHIAVATPGAGGSLSLLYAGALGDRAPTLLPPSWEVDGAPGPEVLHVVLSRQRIVDGEAVAAALRGAPPRGEWTRTLRLPKQAEAGR